MMKPGDILLVRGRSWMARAIRALTQDENEKPTRVTHVGLAVSPTHVVEALDRGVVYRSRVRTGQLWRLKGLTEDERVAIVTRAMTYVGKRYGWVKIALHALDGALGGAYVFRRLAFVDGRPICSWLVASCFEAAGRSFGMDARRASPDDIADWIEEHPEQFERVVEF